MATVMAGDGGVTLTADVRPQRMGEHHRVPADLTGVTMPRDDSVHAIPTASRRRFKVTQPLQDTCWGARFGMLTDRFGVQWMFICMLTR